MMGDGPHQLDSGTLCAEIPGEGLETPLGPRVQPHLLRPRIQPHPADLVLKDSNWGPRTDFHRGGASKICKHPPMAAIS